MLTLSSTILIKFSSKFRPNNSNNTKSLENIWIEKDLFSNAMKDSVEKAENLVMAAESGDKKILLKVWAL